MYYVTRKWVENKVYCFVTESNQDLLGKDTFEGFHLACFIFLVDAMEYVKFCNSK